jgi:hypothetical protein
MLSHSSMRSVWRGFACIAIALELVAAPCGGLAKRYTYKTDRNPKQQPKTVPTVPPSKVPPTHGHPTETNPGNTPHGSSDGPAIAAGVVGAGAIIAAVIADHEASPGHLGSGGPEVPKSFDMTDFAVKGLCRPNWPVVLDFMLDGPGLVQMDIVAADKRQFTVTLTNSPRRRAYAIFNLPPDFGKGLQIAVYRIRSMPAPGSSGPPPGLRTYGLGAGEKAVGSVAIDQLTFQPAAIHPQSNESASYGFHAHSAFDGVRAEFNFTTLFNGKLLVKKDKDAKLSPIPEGERARGTWDGKGKSGEHMLQIRAWRGLENGGDWVVAWSPDIVDVIR